jgi:TetR/AcrR family transcriptional repressor of lmrAB and yxaGH operons
MVETASRLFQRDGYNGTSWRGLVDAAGTPWGSIHHHFPGGKEELGVAAIEFGSDAVAGLIAHCFDSQPDPASAVRESFRLSALGMEASDYRAACPVASVALEVVPDSAPMTTAAGEAFVAWEKLIARRLRDTGIKKKNARELARLVLTMFEGALVLSRIQRTTTPLEEAGNHLYGVLLAWS